VRLARRYAFTTLALAAAVASFGAAALAVETADRERGWLLVAPPPIAEKRALIKIYGASSEAEVQAAVDSLPDHEQVILVTKAYKILTIPTAAARTEALFEALHDTAAPVAAWRLIGTFDTAALCERERRLALEGFERAVERVRAAPDDDEELSVDDVRLFEKLSACRLSRCVPSAARPR
jgi:hypothetical protein